MGSSSSVFRRNAQVASDEWRFNGDILLHALSVDIENQKTKLKKIDEKLAAELNPFLILNCRLLKILDLATECCLCLSNGTSTEIVIKSLHNLNKITDETHLNLLGTYLSKVHFCKISFNKYRKYLSCLRIKHLGDSNDCINSDVKVNFEIQKIWAKFSRWSSDLTIQLIKAGALKELLKDFKKVNKKKRFEKKETSFNLEPTIQILYNIFVREQGRNTSGRHREKAFRCLKNYFKQISETDSKSSLTALMVYITLDNDNKIVLKSYLVKCLVHEVSKAMIFSAEKQNISATEMLGVLINLTVNAKMKKLCLQQDVLQLVVVKALLTPESKWRDLAFKLLLELSFDDSANKLIKENQHLMTILEVHYKTNSLAQQVLWMLDDDVAVQTKSLREMLSELKLKQKDYESSFLLLESNLGLTYAIEAAVNAVRSLMKYDDTSCQIHLLELNSLFESQKDMGTIGDFFANIKFCQHSFAFLESKRKTNFDLRELKQCLKEICLTFSFWSKNFALHLAYSKLIMEFIEDLQEILQSVDYMEHALDLYTVVRTFYNITMFADDNTFLQDTEVLKTLKICAGLQTESLVAMTAIIVLSKVYSQSDWLLDLTETSGVNMIILTTSRALSNENHHYDRFSVSELLRGLENVCKAATFAENLMQMNIISLIKTVLEKGKNIEIEFCENLLHELARNNICLQEMQKDKELMMWLHQFQIELSDNKIKINAIKDSKSSDTKKTISVNDPDKLCQTKLNEIKSSKNFLSKELTLDVMQEINQKLSKLPFDIEDELKDIGWNCQHFKAELGEIEVGPGLLSASRHGIKCLKYFQSGSESDILTSIEELHAAVSTLKDIDSSKLADILGKLNFCQISYQRYKDILKQADLEHFDVSAMEKISCDGRQLLDVIRDCWKVFSSVSLHFALQICEARILPELIQDMIIMIDKTEKELEGSFLFNSSIGVLYNVAKFTDTLVGLKIQKLLQQEKIVDILGNFLHCKPELSVAVLLTLALIVDKSQIHLLISHSSLFKVLPCSRDEWEEKKCRFGNISISEVLKALTNIVKNEKIWRILETSNRDILSLMLNVLKFGDEVEKSQALSMLWKLSLDDNLLKKIKANAGLVLCIKNLANIFETKMTDVSSYARMILNNVTKDDQEIESQNRNSKDEKVTVMFTYASADEERVSEVSRAMSSYVEIIKCVDGKFLHNVSLFQANVLLVCLTLPYLIFGHSLTIIRQAFKMDKPIIFLVFEKQIKLESWMEMLLGTQVLYDFSTYDETVLLELVADVKRIWANSLLFSQNTKKRKILIASLPETLDTYPWDSLNSYNEVISSKEILKALNKLKLPKENVQALLLLLKENHRMFTAFKSVAQCTISLSGASDKACYCTLEELLTRVSQPRDKENVLMGQFLCHFDFCSRSFHKYKSVLGTVGARHGSDIEDKKNVPEMSRMIIFQLLECWKLFSKYSSNFAVKLADSEIFQELEEEVIEKIGVEPQKLDKSQIFDSCISTIYNMATLSALRQKIRDQQFVYALGNFLTYNIEITPKLLVSVALIIDEYQTHLLTSQPAIFNRLLPKSKHDWITQNNGISCKDLLSTLNELSKKDKVKELLVEKDILLLISSILKSEVSSAEEKEEAVKLLMELSFSCENKTKIKSLIYTKDSEKKFVAQDAVGPGLDIVVTAKLPEPDLLTCLKTLVDKGNAESRKAANRILWWLQMDSKTKENTKHATREGRGHIMISYNSSDRETLKKVYDALRAEGYKVWMDIYEIKGSSLDSMAVAVENSEVILMCMSEKYKDSANCRLEAEYAANCGKPIIPLLMQHSYKPNGWLGILLGSKIFYEFSGEKYTFIDKMQDLIREIGNRGKITDS